MLDILIYYVVPNVAMFGTLYLVGRFIEDSVWSMVVELAERFEKNSA